MLVEFRRNTIYTCRFFLHFNFLIALWILSIVMGLFRNCNKSDWPFSPFSLLSFGDDLTSFTLHIIHVIVVKIVDMRRVDFFFKIFHKLWQGRTFGWISRFWRFPEFPVGIWIFCFHIYKLTKFDLLVVYFLFFWIDCLYCRNIILYSPCRVLNFLCLAILFKTC